MLSFNFTILIHIHVAVLRRRGYFTGGWC